MSSGKWIVFYNTHFYHVVQALVSYNHGSCCMVRLVSSLQLLLTEAKAVHHTLLCFRWMVGDITSLAWPCSHLCQASFVPLAFSPWQCHLTSGQPLFCRACTEGPLRCPAWGSLQGHEGLVLLLWGLLDTHVNCKRVVYFSMVGIGTHSSLGETPALCFFLFPVGRMQPLYRNSLRPFMNGTPWIITFQSSLKLLIGLVV